MASSNLKISKRPYKIIVISMRVLFFASSLSLILADGVAAAQGSDQTKPDRPKSSALESAAEFMAQCTETWDAGTHMTKQQWARACRRVVDSRVKFRLEQGIPLR